jgi:hypothetical protein
LSYTGLKLEKALVFLYLCVLSTGQKIILLFAFLSSKFIASIQLFCGAGYFLSREEKMGSNDLTFTKLRM